jgi:hypothetical protein
MAVRFVKDATRQESPRLKDVPQGMARDTTDGRGAHGQFAPGHRLSEGQGVKALIRKGLGNPEDPETGERTREALRLYYALVGKLPSDGPAVRALCAAQARHTVLASAFATEASRAGLTTKEGLALAEASRAHDTTAQRMSVAAYDRAVREAKAKPKESAKDALTRRIFALNGKGQANG